MEPILCRLTVVPSRFIGELHLSWQKRERHSTAGFQLQFYGWIHLPK